MTILQANLKHLYQRRALILMYLFVGLIYTATMPIALRKGEGFIFSILLFMFIVGVFAAAMQIEILTKPFSYCLPGHRKVPVKLLTGTCFVISFIPAVMYLFINRTDIPHAMLSFAVTYAISVAFFWLGVWLVFRFRRWAGAMGLIGLTPMAMMYTKANLAVENFLIANWLAVILLGIGSVWLGYRFLHGEGFARKYCGKMWMGAFDAWNKSKMVKFQQIRQAEKDHKKEDKRLVVSPRVEGFFLGKISDRSMGEVERHIWSALYRSFAIIVSNNKWMQFFLWMPLLVCWMCYMGPGSAFIYVFPAFMAVHMSLGVHSSLLMAGGRKERFYSAIALVFTVTMLIMIGLLAASYLSVLIAPVMPKIPIHGTYMSFSPLNARLSFLTLLMMPLVFAISSLFPKPTMLSKMMPAIIFMVIFQFLLFSRIMFKKPIPFGPELVVVLSWVLLVVILRYVCMRRCLVSN